MRSWSRTDSRRSAGYGLAVAPAPWCECPAAILDLIETFDGLPLNGRIVCSLRVRIVQMLTRLGASIRVRALRVTAQDPYLFRNG
jgi:hypothetical protein